VQAYVELASAKPVPRRRPSDAAAAAQPPQQEQKNAADPAGKPAAPPKQ
jgi:hypothetical protein